MNEPDGQNNEEPTGRSTQRKIEEDIALYQSQLDADWVVFTGKNQLAKKLSSSQVKLEIKNKLELCGIILTNTGITLEKEVVDKFFQVYDEYKRRIPYMTLIVEDVSAYKECRDLQEKFNNLMKNKEEYVKKRGLDNFSLIECRLLSIMHRSELKRDCCSLNICLKNIEKRIETLQTLDKKFKTGILIRIILPVEVLLKKHWKDNVAEIAAWQEIKKFFQATPLYQVLKPQTNVDTQRESTASTSTHVVNSGYLLHRFACSSQDDQQKVFIYVRD